ncbi:hypothetical protein, partial [Herminiimonas sp. CN]|uniref:hypothetical protein n=1 Tax=Herminiimonas sp. CN TaxID=1349818 RepID=UPI001EE65509
VFMMLDRRTKGVYADYLIVPIYVGLFFDPKDNNSPPSFCIAKTLKLCPDSKVYCMASVSPPSRLPRNRGDAMRFFQGEQCKNNRVTSVWMPANTCP